jgi:hypothetical protein
VEKDTMTKPSMKLCLILVLSLAAVGCAHAGTGTGRGGQDSRYTRSQERPIDPIVACYAVQRDRGIPVVCKTGLIENVPSMIIGFRSGRSAQSWIDPMLDAVAAPFCANATLADRPALVFFAFYRDEIARGYNCNTGAWSPWFSTAGRSLVSSY